MSSVIRTNAVAATFLAALLPGGICRASTIVSDSKSATTAFAEVIRLRSEGESVGSAIDVLAQYPRPVLREILERAAASEARADAAGGALAVLERLGGAADVELGVAFCLPGLEGEFERALASIAKRDVRTLAQLERLTPGARTELRVAFVRAVDSLATTDAAGWLARCAERARDVRPEAIARLGRIAELLPNRLSEESIGVVRDVLAGVGSESLREAVVAAGRMEDGDSIPHLLALLAEADPGLRADAAWALQRITGLKLRERRERWEDWYGTELAWWRDRSDQTFADLQAPDAAARTRALMDISGHRASRDRLASRVIPLLDHAEPATAKLAAWTLRVLRAKCAVGPLIRALDHTEPGVRIEAWRALRGITRKDLPEDAALWRIACPA